jgi:hypothetical protein
MTVSIPTTEKQYLFLGQKLQNKINKNSKIREREREREILGFVIMRDSQSQVHLYSNTAAPPRSANKREREKYRYAKKNPYSVFMSSSLHVFILYFI